MSTGSYGQVATYNERYYDSLTEARWSAYFELAGMSAISQPAMFRLNAYTLYTPDFYLIEQDCYVEVKNGNATWEACYKVRRLANALGRTVILADGSPRNIAIYFFSPESNRVATYGMPFPANGFADVHLYRKDLFENGEPRSDDAKKIIDLAEAADPLPTLGADEAAREAARQHKNKLYNNIRDLTANV